MSPKTRITWKNKDNATTQREAIEAIGDFLSSSEGICIIKAPPSNTGPNREAILELKAFAKKWDIPLSVSLLRSTVSLMDRKRWRGESLVDPPQEKDFKTRNEYWAALDNWRYEHTNNHHWVSSSERYSC